MPAREPAPAHAPADTIVALSSAPGVAERAIVRLSGPAALRMAAARLDRPLHDTPAFTHVRGTLELDAIGGVTADVLVFRAPRSYTCEDLVELHVPGSAPVIRALLTALAAGGARPARPGEFTRRAFQNGRLRLDQAEAVLALIAARSADAQRAAAERLHSSARDLPELRRRFLDLLAVVEAYIDFTEEDTEALDRAAVAAELQALEEWAHRALALLARQPTSAPLAEAMLVGPRNAGKTTLFKRLVPGSLALVSPIPGTTRDLLDGVVATEPPFRVWDGPGVGEAVDQLEQQAIARAIAFLGRVDLALVVLDASVPPDPLECHELDIALADRARRVVLTHLDHGTHPTALAQARAFARGRELLSAQVPDAELGHAVAAELALIECGPDRASPCVDARLEPALARVVEHLRHARQEDVLVAAEIVIFELREALLELTELIVPIADEELLDSVFGRFCIGK